MAVWTDPAWLDEAHAWIDRELRRLDLVATGAIAQPHVRPWATALRVPVADGDLWFKATIPLHTYEAGATAILGRRFPQRIPELCAVDLERGWLLMRDAGAPLRGVLARERDLARWIEVLPLYAELQIDATGDRDELLAAGVPDRRLTGLHSRYERLLDEVRGLTGDEQVLLRSLQPRVREMCEELAAYAIPETIQHNDFHDGQVFLQQGGYVFSDSAGSVAPSTSNGGHRPSSHQIARSTSTESRSGSECSSPGSAEPVRQIVLNRSTAGGGFGRAARPAPRTRRPRRRSSTPSSRRTGKDPRRNAAGADARDVDAARAERGRLPDRLHQDLVVVPNEHHAGHVVLADVDELALPQPAYACRVPRCHVPWSVSRRGARSRSSRRRRPCAGHLRTGPSPASCL